MEYIELEKALHIVDVISSDEGIKRKCKAIRKRLKELPTEDVEKVKSEAVKDFAEVVKIKTLAIVHSPKILTSADYIKCIDDIVKEMVGEG